MRDHALCRVRIARARDRDVGPVPARERAAVAGLSAGSRVENRAVEHDAAVADLDHARGAMVEVGIVAEQAFRRHRQSREDYWNGTLMLGCRSSHPGTGRFFERKNSGLNSLD